MRLKLAAFLLVAGTVAGCASNPPPPPPMASAPPPAPMPAPAPMAASDGMYKGMATLAPDAPAKCRKMGAAQTARVRGNTITLGAMKGTIGPDGTISPVGRSGLTGTVTGNAAVINMTKGGCSYVYNLNHA